MKKKYSVNNKEEAIYFNKKVYDGEFGKNYDMTHILDKNHYGQKIFFKNCKKMINNLHINNKTCLKLLDIGAGTGALSLNFYKFIRENDFVYNLDISKVMLNNLKKKLTLKEINQSFFIEYDAMNFLKRENDFDLIGFAGSLHHFFDYIKIIDISCKRLKKYGYLYIALEPLDKKSYFEKIIRNFESIYFRYKKKEFSFLRMLIKVMYTPFHFLNLNKFKWFSQDIRNNLNSEKQKKSEVVVSGLRIKEIKKILNDNNINILEFKGGPDYKYKFTYNLLNFFKLNSHFQLIGRKIKSE